MGGGQTETGLLAAVFIWLSLNPAWNPPGPPDLSAKLLSSWSALSPPACANSWGCALSSCQSIKRTSGSFGLSISPWCRTLTVLQMDFELLITSLSRSAVEPVRVHLAVRLSRLCLSVCLGAPAALASPQASPVILEGCQVFQACFSLCRESPDHLLALHMLGSGFQGSVLLPSWGWWWKYQGTFWAYPCYSFWECRQIYP